MPSIFWNGEKDGKMLDKGPETKISLFPHFATLGFHDLYRREVAPWPMPETKTLFLFLVSALTFRYLCYTKIGGGSA